MIEVFVMGKGTDRGCQPKLRTAAVQFIGVLSKIAVCLALWFFDFAGPRKYVE